MCLAIPPKYAVSTIVGYLKGKSAMIMFEKYLLPQMTVGFYQPLDFISSDSPCSLLQSICFSSSEKNSNRYWSSKTVFFDKSA
jgi:REP element-mobilizing transposase RayT